jgi:hypothetical protein
MEYYTKLDAAIESGSLLNNYDENYYTGYPYLDYAIFSAHREEMERIYLYNTMITEIKNEAGDNAILYRSVGNEYDARKSEATVDIYGSRVITHFYDLTGMGKYLSYDFSSLLLLFLVLIIVCPLFTAEKESLTEKIILTSKKGRHQLARAKKHSAIIAVIFCSLIVYLSDLILLGNIAYLSGWQAPIYQIERFQLTPLTISVWQYAMVSLILKCSGMVIFSQFVALFSALLKSTINVFIFSALAVIMSMWLYEQSIFDHFNPISFLCNRDFLSLPSFTNFIGWPVSSFVITLFLGALMMLVMYTAVSLCYGKEQAGGFGRFVSRAQIVSRYKTRFLKRQTSGVWQWFFEKN